MSAVPARRYLGVDAGGTSTRCAIVDEHGVVLGRGLAGPANHHTSDPDDAHEAVRSAIRAALAAAAAVAPGRVRAAAIGWSALESDGSERTARAIVGEALDVGVLVLDSDVTVAHRGAFMGGPGVLVAAGTGSIVLAVDERGRRTRVGGWGHRYGDEGSAVWIASEGIRAALRAFDGRGPATALWRALLAHVEHRSPAGADDADAARRVTDWLYRRELHLNDIASFAARVHACALAGDTAAELVLGAAGTELAEAIDAAIARAGWDGPVEICGIGGVWENAPQVREACRSALRARRPDDAIAWVAPARDPAVGAAMMAMRADGVTLPRAQHDRAPA